VAHEKHSPLSSEDLNDVAAWPFPDGADEITIRVSRYEADLTTPLTFQAIVRGQDRTRVWGVGVRKNPVAALLRAFESFYSPKPDIAVEDEPGELTDSDIEDLLS
jgi:hypothetical protein